MHPSAQLAALAALGLIHTIQAVPLIDALTTVRLPVSTASSSSYNPVYGSDSYLPYTYASTPSSSAFLSSSAVLPSPSGSIRWNAISSTTGSSSLSTPTPTAGVNGTLPPFTVVTETFTIPLGPSSTACSGSASVPSAEPTLSSVLATFTIPYGNTSTTLLHTFTYTPGPSSSVSSSSGSPFPTTSVFISPLPSQSLSVVSASSASFASSKTSVASAESIFKSILSQLGTGTLGSQTLRTLPVTETGKKEPMSEVTASFTVTMPTGKPKERVTFASFQPTYSGPMITASFTLTLPPPPTTMTTTTKETSKVDTTSDTTCTTTTSSSSTCETTTTSSKHITHTWPETRTYTLSTKVTFTLSPAAPTGTYGPTGPTGTSAASWSPVPSGTGAITLTYTLPAGPGRTSQVVTITTVRPVGPAGTGTGTVSGFPSFTGTGVGSISAPVGTGYPRSSLSWSFSSNSSAYYPTGSGFSTGTGPAFSILPTGQIPDWPFPTSEPHSPIVATATATATATKVTVVTLTRTHIQTHTALAESFTPPASKPLEETTMFVTIARRAAPISTPSSSSSSSGIPIFTISWPSEPSSISSSASASSTVSSASSSSLPSASANTTSSVSSSYSPIFSYGPSSFSSSVFAPVIASPIPIARSTRKVRRAPTCEDNNVVINFDGGTKPTPSDLNDPDNEMHFGTGFSRIIGQWGDAFKASSRPGLLQFVPNRFGGATSGEIKTASACMRFNLNSFTIGCSTMYAECRVNVKGVRTTAGVDETVATKMITVPSTQKLVNNDMQLISLDSTDFANLTSVVVGIELDGPPFPSWFMDDLSVDLLCSESCPTHRSLEHEDSQKSGAIPYWRKSV
ncbi:hypothetical protein F503_01406 [Ophiostoma piceae UAMH 11346]|uniref:DUF7371 domain-containing protein n=1 Tax=Ophiostoma piceae (strain UAMH 11346) TaxID=1262450 RepID=S3BV55_OPHP1|nr:hypothetical protein F503_01406 [Ophiostoma piceae UAMH 11346]